MVAELSESFLYAQSACGLWKELQERYGQSNGPLIYQIERELSKVNQGIQTVAAYSNKLKRGKLIQFLMKLDDEYEYVRGQILSMDPLPTLNKAYDIVQQVEKQKQVTLHEHDRTAFYANNKGGGSSGNIKKSTKDEKKCTFCSQEGHVFEECFERIRYPDWNKGRK
ncbi:uncharacterized protein [Rutidosis leptorrhynchoides]|uniref:uncharacterized protein n=1 Tax=Rutidosis leptorrhynchoides TaxID=125765 RepID=UPI003A9938F8